VAVGVEHSLLSRVCHWPASHGKSAAGNEMSPDVVTE
jgi:hypothetical protein